MVLRVGDQQKTIAGGNWAPWSILAVSSSIYFGRILQVLAVFPGLIYSGYSGYCKVSISDVCTARAACVLGVQYTAHHVSSTRSIGAFSIADTPSTRSINLEHHDTRVPQYSQYQQYPNIEPKHVTHVKYVQRVVSTIHR